MTRFVRFPIAGGKVPTIEASSKILLIHHHPRWIVKTGTNHQNERSSPNQIRIFPRVEVSLPFQRGIFANGASLEIYCTEKIWEVLYNAVAGSRKSYMPTTILILLVVFGMGYCTQSTPFQAWRKQGTAVGSEIGQPGKFVETLGVLWFQSPKMARNAFTAAEDTIKHYSHVFSNILEHCEKKNSTSTNSWTGLTIKFLQLKKRTPGVCIYISWN